MGTCPRPPCAPSVCITERETSYGSESVRHLARNGVADPLDNLHDDDENNHNRHQHTGLIPVVAILNGHIADTTSTDSADHRGVTNQ